jgi:hypothetical protein
LGTSSLLSSKSLVGENESFTVFLREHRAREMGEISQQGEK